MVKGDDNHRAENKEQIMKNTAALIMALGLALPAVTFAQDGNQQRPPRGERPPLREGGPGGVDRPPGTEGGPAGEGQRRPVPPLMAALDANHDGVIDEEEIKNAPAALRKLDKNGDGKLTMDELRPQRPDGAGGPPQGGEGVGPRDKNAAPAEGGRPPRRGQRPPDGQ